MVEIKIMCNEKLSTIESLICVKLWTGFKVGAEKPLKTTGNSALFIFLILGPCLHK